MKPTKLNKRTMPKRKPIKAVSKTVKKAKIKIKPKFNLKGIPVKYNLVCAIVHEHANTQT